MDDYKFQKQAFRDWLAGRNLEEAAKIMYGTTDPEGLKRMVELRREEIAALGKKGQVAIRAKKGQSIDVEGLGKLKHDGKEFVVKKKTPL